MQPAELTNGEIWASQPSDCRVPDKELVNCNVSSLLTVNLVIDLMYAINGPAVEETAEEWRLTIHHLLHTHQPRELHILFREPVPHLKEGFTEELPDGRTYTGILTKTQTLLRVFW